MRILIPFICAALFALGGYGKIPFLFIKGWNAKLWRWLMGGFIGLLLWHGVITFGLLLLTSGGAFYCVERFKIPNPYAELLRGGSCLL